MVFERESIQRRNKSIFTGIIENLRGKIYASIISVKGEKKELDSKELFLLLTTRWCCWKRKAYLPSRTWTGQSSRIRHHRAWKYVSMLSSPLLAPDSSTVQRLPLLSFCVFPGSVSLVLMNKTGQLMLFFLLFCSYSFLSSPRCIFWTPFLGEHLSHLLWVLLTPLGTIQIPLGPVCEPARGENTEELFNSEHFCTYCLWSASVKHKIRGSGPRWKQVWM